VQLERRQRIKARLSLLELRLDLQQSMRRLDRVAQQAEQGAEGIRQSAEDLDQRRPYQLVGRLTTSAVYNGDRLPLMYRLQSVEGQAHRTLAYIVPNEKFDLRGKLDSIVGVQGRVRVDEALGAKIVRPERVDALEPVASASE